MAEHNPTTVENKLNEMMEPHNSYEQIVAMCEDLKNQAMCLRHLGSHHPEVIAFAFAQHAAAMVAAMKIAKQIRSELADALAQDFYETVKDRSVPGAGKLG
jgi:hypothetical protein